MTQFLRNNIDIFAWNVLDLEGIDPGVAVHHLNVDLTYKPVKQKKRHFGPEKDKVIQKEVEKLLEAGHIRESNSWNGCQTSMMDASQGYHQIMLTPEDHKKISFITSTGTYCYVVMPFGLKNAGATYQRLVDRMFKEQLGQNMEVYVDDMLFLGYMVTKRGIEVNPEKVKAVQNMAPLNSINKYDIDYQPRVAIKAQALADFLQEMTPTDEVLEAWLLHVDGSATISGCGAGIVLTNPEGEELEFAVRFKFKTSNNEAEYEALVRGLKMALELGVRQLSVFSDSRLVMQQVRGEFVAKEKRLRTVYKIDLNHIPRAENVKADYLAKIASSTPDCKTRKITLLTAYQHSIVIEIASMEEKYDWRTNILKYLREGKLPQNKREARAYSTPYLRCLSQEEGAYVLREIHEGGCGSHGGGRALACKMTRVGYFWPSLKDDAQHLVGTCEKCQKHASLIHKPAEELKVMSSPCPFSKWGIDIVGPFPLAIGQRKFLIVAVDYFSKWIEAEPVAKITESQVMKFLWGSIVYEDQATLHTSVAHPQANGQVEVTNRIILQGIKTRLDRSGGGWVDELDSVLWAYRTTPRTTTGETPFSLVYAADAVIPIGLMMRRERKHTSAWRHTKAESELGTLGRSKIRNFQVGDLVLRRADALKQTGKLEANWEGPYKVTRVIAGGAYELEDERGNKIPRPWNICHLKKFYM
ncbi:hypothetical protein Pfo_008226 [Paulownia fortunei]|nr:hypothetical protein Pfo_008226 [Paulownia fortunei]